MAGAMGPRWTYDPEMEKPAGERDMGTYTESVYTAEQQKRLRVDMHGKKTKKPMAGAGSMGPRWTWDPKMEKPAGEKDMGGWTEAVYTKEQQQRLGVNMHGHSVHNYSKKGWSKVKKGWSKHN